MIQEHNPARDLHIQLVLAGSEGGIAVGGDVGVCLSDPPPKAEDRSNDCEAAA